MHCTLYTVHRSRALPRTRLYPALHYLPSYQRMTPGATREAAQRQQQDETNARIIRWTLQQHHVMSLARLHEPASPA